MRSKILFILLVLVAVAGVGSYAVKAYSGTGVTTVIEHADNVTVNAPETPAPLVSGSLEPQLGGGASPFTNAHETCNDFFCRYTIAQDFMASTTSATPGVVTLSSFYPDFLTTTSSPTDVVVKYDTAGFGWTVPTSSLVSLTVTFGNRSGGTPTTTWEGECSQSSNPYTTSTYKLIDTEVALGANKAGVVTMGMTSSTNPGAGSLVWQNINYTSLGPVYQAVVTPDRPYTVCKAFSTGTPLDTFSNSANGVKGTVTAVYQRQR